jgi:hypothetical protein
MRWNSAAAYFRAISTPSSTPTAAPMVAARHGLSRT